MPMHHARSVGDDLTDAWVEQPGDLFPTWEDEGTMLENCSFPLDG